MKSIQFLDTLSLCFASLDGAGPGVTATGSRSIGHTESLGTTPVDHFRSPLGTLQGDLDKALDGVMELVLKCASSVSGQLRATRDLPVLREFLREQVKQKVAGLTTKAKEQISAIIELEQAAPLPTLAGQ